MRLRPGRVRAAVCLLLLGHGFWATGCATTSGPSAAAAVAARADSPNAAAIRKLIDGLAISQEAASDEPVFTPSRDTPGSDPRVAAYDAAERLEALGIEAFPLLLDSLGDQRQSVAFRRVLPSTVGDACYVLVSRQLYSLPPNYQGSFFRTGADGRGHARPVFSKDLLTPDNLKGWLAARAGRTLPELQLEALGWVLAEEERIGAAAPEDEERFLAPLRARYAQLKAAAGA